MAHPVSIPWEHLKRTSQKLQGYYQQMLQISFSFYTLKLTLRPLGAISGPISWTPAAVSFHACNHQRFQVKMEESENRYKLYADTPYVREFSPPPK